MSQQVEVHITAVEWAAEIAAAKQRGAAELAAKVGALLDATFVPDFGGVDWTGGDRTVQRFVSNLRAALRADGGESS